MPTATERVAAARERIDTIEQFMADVKRVGGRVPEGLQRAVDRYILAARLGEDMAVAAIEVDAELRAVYADLYQICREEHGSSSSDDYWVCRAGVDRLWQARNTQRVLDWNDDRSWVRKVWERWKERLAKALEP